MSDDNYDSYMDDYDHYQHTGELSELFDDEYDDEYDEEPEEECTQTNTNENPNIMGIIKLNELKENTEIRNREVATKCGIELKNFVFRYECKFRTLHLYIELSAIADIKIEDELELGFILYDKDGDILETESEFMSDGYFKDFKVIKFDFYNIEPSELGRAVLYFQNL